MILKQMKSHAKIFLFTIRDGKRFKIRKNLQCKSFVPYFQNVNGFFEENNGNKYLSVVPTNESKGKIKKYEELWIKFRDLIRSITKSSDDYDEKYMKTKFNSDDELPLSKMIEIDNIKNS